MNKRLLSALVALLLIVPAVWSKARLTPHYNVAGNTYNFWLYLPDGYEQTSAELGVEVKNTISHRARAVEALCKFLHNKGRK